MQLQPVNQEAFEFVFSLANAAIDMKIPAGAIPTMVGKTVAVELGGKPTRITFQNNAVVRLWSAVASQMGDPQECLAAVGRIFHLYGLLEKPEAQPFTLLDGTDRLIHPAFLSVAAIHPIDTSNGFSADFFAKVAQLSEEMVVQAPIPS